MEKEQQVINKVEQHGLLPLFYHDDSSTCIAVMKALYEAGVRCVEFTNRGPLAIHNFKQLVQLRDAEMKGMLLATGTIKTPVQAKQFIDAGADFLISPYFDNAICEEVYQQKMCWIPGCMTPSEIHVAEKAGCKIIKLFPGNIL
ncbi:MAG: bifunctional 4-hydroxy-2-oxoglutarate aldolase/2-dehydro-3-deoxy-phosphogluconate aldolase, partial [Bacteroidetes bacterium]|nr:bifunctional 4-hydroxy-2-oxoglutarate aldolase/2-dehydro-3-deoxy-phosphogluconate aldolase [Bacteroidota bacterium]